MIDCLTLTTLETETVYLLYSFNDVSASKCGCNPRRFLSILGERNPNQHFPSTEWTMSCSAFPSNLCSGHVKDKEQGQLDGIPEVFFKEENGLLSTCFCTPRLPQAHEA